MLATLPDGSVDSCITSPPYWGLRDYDTPGQIGLEETPEEYVENLVAVFQEVRRVLTAGATLWLNLGDTYASKARGTDEGWSRSRLTNPGTQQKAQAASMRRTGERHRGKAAGLKEKDLVGIPWRVALALQADGWYLRSDIIWSKPNPMPESVTDRPTKAHEYVFLLSKQPRYWFDQEAVREANVEVWAPSGKGRSVRPGIDVNGGGQGGGLMKWNPAGRNVRSVWEIPTQPFSGAHFATFPPGLVRRALLAGCPAEVCRSCGKPRDRIVERGKPVLQEGTWSATGAARFDVEAGEYVPAEASSTLKHVIPTRTVGWTDCGHGDYRPGIVVDPFMGAGTTALVAREQGRHAVGIELNEEYARIIAVRVGQQSLLS